MSSKTVKLYTEGYVQNFLLGVNFPFYKELGKKQETLKFQTQIRNAVLELFNSQLRQEEYKKTDFENALKQALPEINSYITSNRLKVADLNEEEIRIITDKIRQHFHEKLSLVTRSQATEKAIRRSDRDNFPKRLNITRLDASQRGGAGSRGPLFRKRK